MKQNNDNQNLPSTRVMVKEKYELVQLADCCLYVLPSNFKLDGKQAEKHFEEEMRIGSHDYINQYDFEVLEELPCMCNHLGLEMAIKEGDYNLIMGMNNPLPIAEKQYLLVKSDKRRLQQDIHDIIHTSEAITKHGLQNIMLHHATCSSKGFMKSTEHIWKKSNNWNDRVDGGLPFVLGGACGAFAALPSGPGLIGSAIAHGIGKLLTHRKKMEIQDNFVSNLKALKTNGNDRKALAEIQVALESMNINNKEMVSYLKNVPESLMETFANDVIPKRIAEHSTMKMEVRWVGKVDTKKTTDGLFRLFLYKDGMEEQQVHFKRNASCILYFIYLRDIARKDHVDTLDIYKYKKVFCYLFNQVYGYDGGLDYFNTMLSIGNGHSEQKLLRHCLNDIRMGIGNACEKLNEAATPYVLKDANSHLCVLQRNVIVDKRLTVPIAVP